MKERARLLLFGDSHSAISKLLIESAVLAARARADLEVVAICDASRIPTPGPGKAVRYAFAAIGKRMFDRAHPIVLHRPMFESLAAIADRLDVPLVVPPKRNINGAAFRSFVRDELRAEFALSLICLQILRPALLGTFRSVVNYHNGLLPGYRGLRTTSWSVYRDEARTGYTYHLMTKGIDEGPILIGGSVPVTAESSVAKLEWDKAVLAAAAMGDVLDALVSGDPGRPQVGKATYHQKDERQALLTVPDPSRLTWNELRLRLRAFEMLTIWLDGEPHEVTKLRRLDERRPRRPRKAFVTSDGVAAEPTRWVHLPYLAYRCYRPLRAASRPGRDRRR